MGAATCTQEETSSEVDTMDNASIVGRVWQMSQDKSQCHDVQRLLEESDEKVKLAISEELRGHIWDAIQHPYANFVVQKCIETLRPSTSQFIIDELMPGRLAQQAAQHKFGCRIIQRLLEYCRADQVYELVGQLLSEALALTRSTYGVYVIKHLLEYACSEHQSYLVDLLVTHASEICSSNISCSVVEALLQNGNDEERAALVSAIIKSDGLKRMARFDMDTSQ